MEKQKIYKALETIGYGICIFILVWFVASFIDVNMHNMPWQDQQYQVWNAFTLLLKAVGKA